jgi:hypothetical protein
VKPGWQTTEFYFSGAATLLTLLYASGLLTSNTALAIAGMVATILTALGYKVSRTLVKTAALLALVVLGLGAAQLACTPAQVANAKATAWKCTDPVRAEAVAALTPLAVSGIRAAASYDGKLIDASAIKAMFTKANLLSDAGVLVACVAADAFATAMIASTPQPGAAAAAPLELDRDALRKVFDEIRAAQFPGATFVTAHGEI